MPLVRISLLRGKPQAYLQAISEGIHQGIVSAYGAPQDDRFHLIQQHEPGEFVYDAGYLGIRRTDDLVIINIIAGNWRGTTQKKALYKAIVDNLSRTPGLRPEDVLILLTSNERDEWSFGNGLASYVQDPTATPA